MFTAIVSPKMAYRPFFDPSGPKNTKLGKNHRKKFLGPKFHFHPLRITITPQISENEQKLMTAPDAPHKFIDMRELGHFTHTQWNLEPYFLTKNGSTFQIYRVSFAQSKWNPNVKA